MQRVYKKIKTLIWRLKSFFAMYYYGNPSKKLKIIGVTGTNGKTTTATLLYKIATELGHKSGLIGTAGNIILKEKRESTHTTPDSISLTKLFREMLDAGCEYVFMEVSSHALDQGRVKGVNFTGAIFTNLTHDHLDYHKSVKNYFEAKKKLFKMLKEDSFALSNTDDEHGSLVLDNIKAKKYSYGFNGGEDFHGDILELSFSGIKASFNGVSVYSKLLGKFNAYNMLSVWSTCKLLGFDMDKVGILLQSITPPEGRFDFFIKNGIMIIVDYAHTPDALEKVLITARDIKNKESKLISVFGCGGDRDPMKRRVMGKIGVKLSDFSIFTSDNPRSEDPIKIIEEMKTDLSMNDLEKVKVVVDRKEAILESVKVASVGDIIICAGKGHEKYQEIKGIRHNFNDMEEYKKLF